MPRCRVSTLRDSRRRRGPRIVVAEREARKVAVTDLGRDEGPPDPPALLDPLPLQEDLLRHPDDEEVVAILKKTVADPAVAAADSAQVQGLVAEMQALSKKITAALGAP